MARVLAAAIVAGVIVLCALAAVAAGGSEPAKAPELAAEDRTRLAEAFRLAGAVQEKVWPGWKAAPFEVLLIRDDWEYLINTSRKPEGFKSLGDDAALGREVLARPRVFQPNLLATFPAFGPPATIVVGTPEATGKRSTEWVVTVLHEHFHQLEYSSPGYQEEVEALGLAGSDTSGMWMLDYPFPYDAADVGASFSSLAGELSRLVTAQRSDGPADAEAFWGRYTRFARSLEPADYRYLSLQLWQEGIARYAELQVAEAAAGYQPTPSFTELKDFEPFDAVARRIRSGIVEGLTTETLVKEGRVAFYAFGAGLGLLLDTAGVDWKGEYLRQKFYLEAYAGGGGAKREVLEELERYYDDFSARDWKRFADHFWPGATLTTVWQPPGETLPRVVATTVPDFVGQAPQGPGSKPIFEERMTGAEVTVTGNLAQVWARHTARFGEPDSVQTWKGIDAITLMRHEGRWRIVSLAYTDAPD